MSKIGRGRRKSEETKMKLSLSHKGKRFSATHKKNLSLNHKNQSGKNNPMYGRILDKASNWKGGTSFEPYCKRFNSKLREQIRIRDKHTCQLCGAKENNRKLAVHHIHYDKKNCEPDLITLCCGCNSKVNFKRDYYESIFMNILNLNRI